MSEKEAVLTSDMNKKEFNICALVLDPYDVSPGQRFRIEQWEPFLKKSSVSIDYFSFTNDKLREVIYKEGHITAKIKELMAANVRRFRQILKAKNYDAVFLYRAASMVGPAWFEQILKWQKIPVIYDFDDAIFITDTSKANKKFGWAKFSSSKTAEICRLSTVITVGNSYLADYARKYNEEVITVPTSIDTIKYNPSKIQREKSENKRVVIGWTGSSTSQYHLEMFEPVLEKFLKERDVEIRVISNRRPAFTKVPCEWHLWTPESEVEEVGKMDIGIMPTPDDEWSRGKCALKALQYMALGIPAVCTNMGANRDVVKNGVNGYLAKTEQEWLEALKKLTDDAELRQKLGDAARQTVLENYSMERCAQLFLQAVERVKEIKAGRRKELINA